MFINFTLKPTDSEDEIIEIEEIDKEQKFKVEEDPYEMETLEYEKPEDLVSSSSNFYTKFSNPNHSPFLGRVFTIQSSSHDNTDCFRFSLQTLKPAPLKFRKHHPKAM